MKCIYCGAELDEGSNFCGKCGKQQKEVYGDFVQGGAVGPRSPEEIYQYHEMVSTSRNKVVFYLLLVSVICSIGFCFLPFLNTGSDLVSMNFVYAEVLGTIEFKDGLLVVISCGISLFLLLFKLRIPVCSLQIMSLAIFAIDYFNDKDKVGSNYAIGFYLVFIALLVSVILSLTRAIGGKRRFK